jgi:AraC-like DNA-binding protein
VGQPSHLLLQTFRLAPGEEWEFPNEGWTFAWVASGESYLLGSKTPLALTSGSLAVSTGGSPKQLRASQIAFTVVHWFRLSPAALFGVLTMMERRGLDHPEGLTPAFPWVLGPETEPAQCFSRVVASGASRPLSQRGRLLEIVSLVLSPAPVVQAVRTGHRPDAGDRLEEILSQLTDSELLALSAGDLAEMCRCEKRRLLLLFRERFGGSLPGQQAEWRRIKACSLLSQPGASVVSVARACGYEEPDAFRAWFRRQFGKAPAQWRREMKGGRPGSDVSVAIPRGFESVPMSSPNRHQRDNLP